MAEVENTFNVFVREDIGGGSSGASSGGGGGDSPKQESFAKKVEDGAVKANEDIKGAGAEMRGAGGEVETDLQKDASKTSGKVGNTLNNVDPLFSESKMSDSKVIALAQMKINEGISTLLSGTSDTFSFLMQAGASFLGNVVDKIMGALLSRIHLPELMFVAGLEPLLYVSDPAYKDNYARRLCIKRDLAWALKELDKVLKITYSNTDSSSVKEAIAAAENGCPRVARYILRELYKEERELVRSRKVPSLLDPVGFPKNQNEAKRIDSLIYTCAENRHMIVKEIIVGSFSNLMLTFLDPGKDKNVAVFTTVGLKQIITEFDIHPSAFGTTDKEFGKKCLISESDLNRFVPFYKPKKPQHKLTTKVEDGVTTYYDDQKEISKDTYEYKKAQNSSTGSLAEDINGIPSTRLVPNNLPDIKYIDPKNYNIKRLYIYLVNRESHGDYILVNRPLYERLKYPIYSTLLGALDSAAAGLFNVGLGKMFFGAILSIESALYDYVKSVENYLYDPTKVQYLSINDFEPLPEPEEPQEPGAKPTVVVPLEKLVLKPIENNVKVLPGRTLQLQLLAYPANSTQTRVSFETGCYDKAERKAYCSGKLSIVEKQFKEPEKIENENGIVLADVFVTADDKKFEDNSPDEASVTHFLVARYTSTTKDDDITDSINIDIVKPKPLQLALPGTVGNDLAIVSLENVDLDLNIKNREIKALKINVNPFDALFYGITVELFEKKSDGTINDDKTSNIASVYLEKENLIAINPRLSGEAILKVTFTNMAGYGPIFITKPIIVYNSDEPATYEETSIEAQVKQALANQNIDTTPRADNDDIDIDDPAIIRDVRKELFKGVILPTWTIRWDSV